MMTTFNQINNMSHLNFIYGTAWKEEATTELVTLAIQSGFRAIDTANQRKHYNEPAVGEALQHLYTQTKGLKREDIFLQTKFTFIAGQDHRIPYSTSPSTTTKEQVWQSFNSSLNNLKTEYLDSYLLHGPQSRTGLTEKDFQAWEAIEEIYLSKKSKMIGVSNFTAGQLKTLSEKNKVKPMYVQNRCFAQEGWDKNVREVCKAHNIIYQGFSLLTANIFTLQDPNILKMAKRLHKTPMQIIFRFCQQIGILPLTGTSNKQHMLDDLAILDFELNENEITMIEVRLV